MTGFFRTNAFNVLLAGGLALVLAVTWAGPTTAEPSKDAGAKSAVKRLEKVKREIGEGREKAVQLKKIARTINEELGRIRRDMVAAASIIQEQERRVVGIEKALGELKATEKAKLAELSARRGQLAGVLVALQRVARYPPEAMISQPRSPADTVRSAILLRAAVPEIENRALRLRDDLESLAEARREMAHKKTQLASVTKGLERERKRLGVLFGQKTALKHRTLAQGRAEVRRLKVLAGQVSGLRELLTRLNKTGRKQKSRPSTGAKAPAGLPGGVKGAPISRQRGKLPPPAVGRIVGRYGQAMDSGLTRKGITLQTAAAAQVVAPYGGRVVFAGKFRGYGQLLIIEHTEGYHSLLSGLARIDSAIGQEVVAGEPVGVMGRPDNRKPVLYVELRRNGRPINPLPWLAVRKGKVNG